MDIYIYIAYCYINMTYYVVMILIWIFSTDHKHKKRHAATETISEGPPMAGRVVTLSADHGVQGLLGAAAPAMRKRCVAVVRC